jgi:hypothetical protein
MVWLVIVSSVYARSPVYSVYHFQKLPHVASSAQIEGLMQ